MASTFTNLLFHVVFSTKYRRNVISNDVQDRLYEYIGGIVRAQKGQLIEIGGMPDHVHFLAKLSPTLAISDVLRVIKANSSKWMNETFSSIMPFTWQRGFGAFSVSMSKTGQVSGYRRNQEKHHRVKTFREEFRELLVRHGIEFDERYVFEEEHIA